MQDPNPNMPDPGPLMPDELSFDGRRILVTGASRGIGRAVTALLAELGATVVAVARDSDALTSCVTNLPGQGHTALALDVGEEDAWRSATTRTALDGVDGVVCAAALLTPIGPIGAYRPADFWQTMRVNVLGTLLAVHSCLDSLEAAGGAAVTFAGGGATSPQPRYDAYATSKAAVVRLTENLGCELSERGVRVNAVSPGFVATGIHAATLAAGPQLAGAEYFASTERRLQEASVPVRLAAELTAFLLDGAAAGITGRTISAQWDPWRDRAFRQRLRTDSDLATLRRIDDQFFSSTAPPIR
jgi:NAD(P)-dependent dehydrogenase (short-subunit alcohol dehydrogenase family)